MPDTIAAIATRSGASALGIIRISGPDAGEILQRVVPRTRALSRPRTICSGKAVSTSDHQLIDDVMCFFAPGPGTATGENVAEIQGHGGVLVMRALLDAVISAGARPALPGEFTSRAFRNGRMDLTQAEAVMALIGARSERAARVAANQLSGAIGKGLSAQYDALTDIAASLEAGLDFPDEDLPPSETSRIAAEISAVITALTNARNSFQLGSRLTDGATIAIAGPANAGKSSLLNRLAREEKALVDAQPGTTRDVVEARGEVNGVAVVYLDTAGFRRDADPLEQRGIHKSQQAVSRADLLLLVVDGTATFLPQDLQMFIPEVQCPVIAVHNKCDQRNFKRSATPASIGAIEDVSVSALTGAGVDDLEGAIGRHLSTENPVGEVVLTTARQHQVISDTLDSLSRGLNALARSKEPELVATDVCLARNSLAELWGRHAGDDVIDRIFSSFCLGK